MRRIDRIESLCRDAVRIGATPRPDECMTVSAEDFRRIDAALDSRVSPRSRNTLPDTRSRLRARLWRGPT